MADNKQWFKVWTSILTDPGFDGMELESIGRWLILGAFTAQHGNNGILKVSKISLAKRLICNVSEIENIIKKLPNIEYETCNDNVTLHFINWGKYQANSHSYERVKKFRMKQRVTLSCNGDKKRREEKRKEENSITKKQSLSDEEWIQKIQQNTAYVSIDVVREKAKMEAWCDTKGVKPTRRRLLNWLNRAEKPLLKEGADWRG